MENQRKCIEEHDIKIQEIENVMNESIADKEETEKQTAMIGEVMLSKIGLSLFSLVCELKLIIWVCQSVNRSISKF